eukprot:118109-Hanusia_phi.AAC.1
MGNAIWYERLYRWFHITKIKPLIGPLSGPAANFRDTGPRPGDPDRQAEATRRGPALAARPRPTVSGAALSTRRRGLPD